jgi:hypothetical protein
MKKTKMKEIKKELAEEVSEEEYLKRQEELAIEHDKEAKRKHAKITNFGWVTDENLILSKTSKGFLESNINDNDEIIHKWEN